MVTCLGALVLLLTFVYLFLLIFVTPFYPFLPIFVTLFLSIIWTLFLPFFKDHLLVTCLGALALSPGVELVENILHTDGITFTFDASNVVDRMEKFWSWQVLIKEPKSLLRNLEHCWADRQCQRRCSCCCRWTGGRGSCSPARWRRGDTPACIAGKEIGDKKSQNEKGQGREREGG